MAPKTNQGRGSDNPKKGVPLDAFGGEVISVTVRVNNNIELIRHATLYKANKYKIDDGTEIAHNRSLGPIALAKKILNRE